MIGDQLAVDESAYAITVLDTKQIDKRLVDDAWRELPANTHRGHEARTPDRFVQARRVGFDLPLRDRGLAQISDRAGSENPLVAGKEDRTPRLGDGTVDRKVQVRRGYVRFRPLAENLPCSVDDCNDRVLAGGGSGGPVEQRLDIQR